MTRARLPCSLHFPTSPSGSRSQQYNLPGIFFSRSHEFTNKLDSAFPRKSGGRSTLFPVKEDPTRLATSSPFPSRSARRKPPLLDNLAPPTGSLLSKASTGSAGPISPSRTLTHVRSVPSATVEQEKRDTARRASGDSTTSGQTNRSIISPNAEESQLSSSRTGSEPPAPLGLRQRPSGAARALWPFLAYERWCHQARILGTGFVSRTRAPAFSE